MVTLADTVRRRQPTEADARGRHEFRAQVLGVARRDQLEVTGVVAAVLLAAVETGLARSCGWGSFVPEARARRALLVGGALLRPQLDR